MFDALQDGVITIENGEINFMNDIFNKLTTELTGLKNFEENINQDEELDKIDPLDRKIFYLFQNETGDDRIKGFKKHKKTSSESEKHSLSEKSKSSKSDDERTEFSLNDICRLDLV